MPAPKSNLKEVNVKRVLSGAQKAGVPIARIEYENNKVVFIPGSPPTGEPPADEVKL